MKHVYLAITIEKAGKKYSFAIKASENENIMTYIKHYQIQEFSVLCCNVFTTYKKTFEVVTAWNESHKANNEYMFHCPLF